VQTCAVNGCPGQEDLSNTSVFTGFIATSGNAPPHIQPPHASGIPDWELHEGTNQALFMSAPGWSNGPPTGLVHVRVLDLSAPCCAGAAASPAGGLVDTLRDANGDAYVDAATGFPWGGVHGLGLSGGNYKLCLALDNAAPFSDDDFTPLDAALLRVTSRFPSPPPPSLPPSDPPLAGPPLALTTSTLAPPARNATTAGFQFCAHGEG
jgi:hypothetical protein